MQRIDTGLWCVNAHLRQLGLYDLSIRMTVIESGGSLLLYSPVALTGETIAALGRLGTVAAIMAPNTFHHRFLLAAGEAFPEAQVLIPAGLEAKIGAVPRAIMMTPERPPPLSPDVDQFIFEGHSIRETVLFHRPSGTLVTSDLLYNFQPEHNRVEKAMFRLMGGYGAPGLPFYHRFALREKAAARRLIDTVRGWNPRRIVMSHGRIAEGEHAVEAFVAAWARLASA